MIQTTASWRETESPAHCPPACAREVGQLQRTQTRQLVAARVAGILSDVKRHVGIGETRLRQFRHTGAQRCRLLEPNSPAAVLPPELPASKRIENAVLKRWRRRAKRRVELMEEYRQEPVGLVARANQKPVHMLLRHLIAQREHVPGPQPRQ